MFALHYREFWSNVSEWLVNELDQMAASAQTRWAKQHTTNGEHTDITATSVVTDTVDAETVTATSQVLVPYGTAAAPGLAFADATATGLYSGDDPLSVGVSLNGTLAASLAYRGTAARNEFRIASSANGTGTFSIGSQVIVGRNTSGSGSAGCLVLVDRAGTEWALWVDAGKLRIGSPPNENDFTFPHTGGTVVGTQV